MIGFLHTHNLKAALILKLEACMLSLSTLRHLSPSWIFSSTSLQLWGWHSTLCSVQVCFANAAKGNSNALSLWDCWGLTLFCSCFLLHPSRCMCDLFIGRSVLTASSFSSRMAGMSLLPCLEQLEALHFCRRLCLSTVLMSVCVLPF